MIYDILVRNEPERKNLTNIRQQFLNFDRNSHSSQTKIPRMFHFCYIRISFPETANLLYLNVKHSESESNHPPFL